VAIAVGIRIRFFARLREQAAAETESIEVAKGSTLADVYAILRGNHPALPEQVAVRAALNQEFADWNTTVAADDEVVFIPPVSGGF